ncbi:MAG TPA: hypothetical protein VF069_03320 [Streptosporangiaceae bacterium]
MLQIACPATKDSVVAAPMPSAGTYVGPSMPSQYSMSRNDVLNSDWSTRPASTKPNAVASTIMVGQPRPPRRAISRMISAAPPYSGPRISSPPRRASGLPVVLS